MVLHRVLLRRRVLAAGIGMAGLGLALPGCAVRNLGGFTFRQNPFTLGVAAGDPAADGFVIWTRLAPAPLAHGGGMPDFDIEVGWEVATDPQFGTIVREGRALARAQLAHSVHVEVAGLQPQRPYWYRFHAPGLATSAVGKARTLPLAGSAVQQVRLASVGCQDYERGLYTAYRHLAQEPEIDAVFHYGDYIYELGQRSEGVVRQHLGGETETLADYRLRHSQYRLDPDLQAAHAAAAFIMTFDDHEVDDNWAGDHGKDGWPRDRFVARRRAALQAWYEHMPVRPAMWPGTAGAQTFRRFDFGQLLSLHALDTRSLRSRQHCEDPAMSADERRACTPAYSPADTMLGQAQEAWLAHSLSRKAGWQFLAQQVMVMPYDARKDGESVPRRSTDNWSGYPHARARLASLIRQHAPTNCVIGSGDIHQHLAGYLPLDPEHPDAPPLAAELVATSISSSGTGGPRHANEMDTLTNNPNVSLLNNQRGYHLYTVTPAAWMADYKVMDQVDRAGGSISTLARFAVEQGSGRPLEA